MDAFKTRPKNRLALEPTQRRIRHIRMVLGRNLTFTPCERQQSLASVLSPPSQSAHLPSYPYSIHSDVHSRPATPSVADLASVTSSSKHYFRSPWRSQQYSTSNSGRQTANGPGSDTGSVASAASESGRRSRVREPIARLSASIKATVLSSTDLTGRRSLDVPPSSLSSASTTRKAAASASASAASTGVGSKGKLDADPTALAKHKSLANEALEFRRRAQTPEPRLKATLSLRDRSCENEDIPPRLSLPSSPTLPNSVASPDQEQPIDRLPNGQPAGSMLKNKQSRATTVGHDGDTGLVTPSRREHASRPQLFDSYFTLHDHEDDAVIYTSEVVTQSNNPRYKALEDEDITEKSRRRPGRLVVRIWACPQGSDYCLLLEWKMELCCLRFIGQELRDIPGSFPENTIILGLEDGFYTAPDDDDMPEHPHLPPPPVFDPLERLQQSHKRSYNYESAMRLNNLHECIADTEKSRDEIKQNIEMSLSSADAQLLLQKVRGERTERLWHLQRQIGHELNILDQVHDRAEHLKKRNAERREALAAARERGRTRETYLIESHGNLLKNRESLYDALREHAAKRKDHLSVLFSIYPITESEDDPNLLRILNVPLPNSAFNGIEEETVATSLGFTCHLVILLAYYLRVPLRYPLTPMGSRSTVVDPVSMLIGPKEFPLYIKGQDRYRFEYGVFLLNKNIEQLLHSQGLQFLDLRQTLPNIRYLLESLLTSSPVSKYKARQRQEDKLRHRHSLEERSYATETDDELGAPVVRVQSPDENMGKPGMEFGIRSLSVTDTSLSAKTSRSQSSSQLRHQLDAPDEGYDFVIEATPLSGDVQDEPWSASQSSSRFFSADALPTDDTVERASRLHRASTDFAMLDSYRRLRQVEGEEEAQAIPPPRRSTWGSHDARLSSSFPNLLADNHHGESVEQDASLLGHGDRGDRGGGCGQGSDSSGSTAHEVSHAHHNSLVPVSSTKTMANEVATTLDATRPASARVVLS